MPNRSTIDAFLDALRGTLIPFGDPESDEARTLHNGMIDECPRPIARCASVANVITAIPFGRGHDLDTALRGGYPAGL